MGNCLKLCVLSLSAFLAFGCSAKQEDASIKTQASVNELMPEYDMETPANSPDGKRLVKYARKAIGTPYVRGGSEPGGFDCSGFVKWAYNSVGVELPRTAREQSVVGKKINDVKDMRAGDIVAFNHPRRGYHTGIYVGEGQFIHSPRKRSRVKISSLSDPYFSSTLLGARRVNYDSSTSLAANSEESIADYITQRSLQALKDRNIKATASLKADKSSRKASAELKASKKSGKSDKLSKKLKNEKKSSSKKSKDSNISRKNSREAKIALKNKAGSKKSSDKTVSSFQSKARKSSSQKRS